MTHFDEAHCGKANKKYSKIVLAKQSIEGTETCNVPSKRKQAVILLDTLSHTFTGAKRLPWKEVHLFDMI